MVHVCLFEFAPSTHGWGGERERSAVSHGCEPLQKISPHLLLSPPPHLASIIPVFSKQLRWQWKPTRTRSCLSAGPPPRLLTVGTVCGAFAHRLVRGAGSEKGGWTRRISTVRSSWKEGDESQFWEALRGRCYEPLGLNWAELRCRLAASWCPENRGITKSTASLVISLN